MARSSADARGGIVTTATGTREVTLGEAALFYASRGWINRHEQVERTVEVGSPPGGAS